MAEDEPYQPNLPDLRDPVRVVLRSVLDVARPHTDGALASYIPELTYADPEALGASLVSVRGTVHEAGAVTRRSRSSRRRSRSCSRSRSTSRPRRDHAARRPRAERRALQRHQSRGGIRPTVEPDDQCRCHRHEFAHRRRHGRGEVRAHPRRAERLRRPRARPRRVGVRVRARDRRPQPRPRLPHAVGGHARLDRRGGDRRLFPAVLDSPCPPATSRSWARRSRRAGSIRSAASE